MNIPNLITVIRLLLVPIFGYYMYKEQYFVSIILFLIAGITDVLDGFIARKFNMVTVWGKIIDPVADKLVQITALVFLTIQSLIPPFILIIVMSKELFMGIGSLVIYKKEDLVVSANWYGKMATVIFYIAIAMTIFIRLEKFQNSYSNLLNTIFVTVALLATIFAFIMYSIEYRKIRRHKVN